MMANLRAGLLGVGMMGRNHARVLREIDGVELVGIADPAGDPFGVAGSLTVLPTVEDLIAVGLDLAVVAVPTQFHEDAALKLAIAGVPTMVEKPIAHTVEAGQRMVDAFALAGLVGAVGHIERFNPAIQEMRRRIEAGELGVIYQVVTRRQGPFPGRIADVGVAKDLATHDVDLTAWVAQSPYEVVSAQTQFKSGRPHEDMIAVTGRLASGVIVNHLVNWLTPFKERTTVVTGEKGTFVADTLSGDLTFYANGVVPVEWDSVGTFRGVTEGDLIRFAFAKREPLKAEHEAFRDSVLGLSSQSVTLAEGLRTLQVVEAALESARTGQAVRL
jgi:predicted dehydrogenase